MWPVKRLPLLQKKLAVVVTSHSANKISEARRTQPSGRWCECPERRSLSSGGGNLGSAPMCDFSLHNVKSRPAKVGDKLVTHDFRTGTRGFAASEDASLAVCVLPGTELSFAGEVTCSRDPLFGWSDRVIHYRTAIFRQINKDRAAAHHDAL